MRELTQQERAGVEARTKAFAKRLKTRNHKDDNPQIEFSGNVQFSDERTAELLQPERTESALNEIKRLTIAEDVRPSVTAYLDSRNKQIKQGKQNRLSAAKDILKSRFGFRQK